MNSWKNNNDPWLPLGESESEIVTERIGDININVVIDDKNWWEGPSSSSYQFPSETFPCPSSTNLPMLRLNPIPNDLLYSGIDSRRYIESLESKLKKLKKKENLSSRDIINSLALFQEDQMKHCLNSDSSCFNSNELDNQEISSYVKRRLFPELQALNAGEVAVLVEEDFIAKAFEELHIENINKQGKRPNHIA